MFKGKGLYTANCELKLRAADTTVGGVLMRQVQYAELAPIKVQAKGIPEHVKRVKFEIWSGNPDIYAGANRLAGIDEYDTEQFFGFGTISGQKDVSPDLSTATGTGLFWMIKDAAGQIIGRMSRSFAPPARYEIAHGEVGAVVRWRRSDNAEEYREAILRDEWETVLPDITYVRSGAVK